MADIQVGYAKALEFLSQDLGLMSALREVDNILTHLENVRDFNLSVAQQAALWRFEDAQAKAKEILTKNDRIANAHELSVYKSGIGVFEKVLEKIEEKEKTDDSWRNTYGGPLGPLKAALAHLTQYLADACNIRYFARVGGRGQPVQR